MSLQFALRNAQLNKNKAWYQERALIEIGKTKTAALKLACVLAAVLFCVGRVTANSTEPFHRFWPDNLFAVQFVSDDTGYIAGAAGTVLRTRDAGKNWDALYVGRDELIRRVSFVTELEGWAVGHRGSIFHTVDGGDHWQVQFESPGTYLRDISFVDDQHGWVVGHDASIFHTRDGGKNWVAQEMRGFLGRDLPRFHGVYARDKDTAFVVGEFGTVVHTENGGELWLLTPSEQATTWLAVTGTADTIFAVGLDGNAAYLRLASEDERSEIDASRASARAKKEAKARKKAERRGLTYVPDTASAIPHSQVEYIVVPIASGTTEHFFDAAALTGGSIVAVGRSTVRRLEKHGAKALQVAPDIPLDFIWLGGVTVTAGGELWAVGIRGLVANGRAADDQLSLAFYLGASSNVHLASNRWESNHGR